MFGLAGGLALGAVAAARRGASAFPRLVALTDTGDLLVNPDLGTFSALDPEELDAVPGVASSSYLGGTMLVPADDSGAPDFSVETQSLAYGDAGHRDQPIVREGRLPDPDAVDEIFMSPSLANTYGIDVGDEMPMLVGDIEGLDACEVARDEETCKKAFDPLTVRLVGVGTAPDEVADPDEDVRRISLTPAYLDGYPESILYWGATLHLDGSASPRQVAADIEAMVPREAVAFETTASQVDRFQAAVRPQLVAVAIFGAVVGGAALLLACLALVRHAVASAPERRRVAAMGARPRTLVALGAAHGLVVAAVGAVVAVAVATALSSVAPVGLAHDAEPDWGIDVDVAVFAAGVVISVVVLVAASAAGTWRAQRRERAALPQRPVRVADLVASAGGRPSSVLGAQLAFDGGSGEQAVPVRSTIGTIAVVVAGTIAAATFGASLNRLLATPAQYGTNWDAVLDFGVTETGEGEVDPDVQQTLADGYANGAVDQLLERDDVDGVSVLTFASVEIDGHAVPAMGIDAHRGAAHPTVVDGRLPVEADEVVLGTRLLGRTGRAVGDTVTVSGQDLQIVGRAVFPGYAEYPGQDPTDLGDGAWFTTAGLEPLGSVFPNRHLLVDLAPGVDRATFFDGFEAEGLFEDGVLFDRFRPSTVVNLERVRATPAIVGAALAVLGALAAAHALLLSVRRRRPSLAVLRALGFERRQVAATVAWQATWLALAAIVVGVPLGIIAGRLAWSTTIEALGGVAPSVLPVPVVLAILAATVLLANLVAALPARRAARVPTATTLRAE